MDGAEVQQLVASADISQYLTALTDGGFSNRAYAPIGSAMVDVFRIVLQDESKFATIFVNNHCCDQTSQSAIGES